MPSIETINGVRYTSPDRSLTPALKFLFLVDSPKLDGAFTKVTGIQEDIEVLTQRDGQNPQQVRKMPGTFGGGELKLERGVVSEVADLVTWFSIVKNCGFRTRLTNGAHFRLDKIRSDLDIIALRCNVDGPNNYQEARRVRIKGAWPRRYQLGDFDASSSDYEVESVTFAFEELEITEIQQSLETQLRDKVSQLIRRFDPMGISGFAP